MVEMVEMVLFKELVCQIHKSFSQSSLKYHKQVCFGNMQFEIVGLSDENDALEMTGGEVLE